MGIGPVTPGGVEPSCQSEVVHGSIEFEVVSSVNADVNDVWWFVSTMEGVNYELHPFVHMTGGREHRTLSTPIRRGRVLFRSWLLLFHAIPFDRHSLALVRIEEGRGFVEESTSWLQRRWRHERSLAADLDGGCTITDRLVIEPRLRLSRSVVALIVKPLFRHRHRRLRSLRWGTDPVSGLGET